MYLDWKIVPKENVSDILSKVQSKSFDSLFKRDSAVEISCARLPFYNNFRLYKFTTYATMPSLSLEFLSDGQIFYFLDGAPDPIYRANLDDPIKLTQRNALEYLEFFFDRVEGTDGDIFLILDPENSPYLDAVTDQTRVQIAKKYDGMRVSYQVSPEQFTITTPCYFEGSLVEATIAVHPNGSLHLVDSKLLIGFGGFDFDIDNDYDPHRPIY